MSPRTLGLALARLLIVSVLLFGTATNGMAAASDSLVSLTTTAAEAPGNAAESGSSGPCDGACVNTDVLCPSYSPALPPTMSIIAITRPSLVIRPSSFEMLSGDEPDIEPRPPRMTV